MQTIAWKRQYLSCFDAPQLHGITKSEATTAKDANFWIMLWTSAWSMKQTVEKQKTRDKDVHEQIVTAILDVQQTSIQEI